MIAISGGHYPGARGARDGDFTEYPETLAWAKCITYTLNQMGVEAVLVPSVPLGNKVRWINELDDVKLALEVHFNADPKHKGKGSETLYCPGSLDGKRIAKIIHRKYTSLMPPDRGVKEGWYRMDKPGVIDYSGDIEGDEKPDYFLRATKCPAVIVEPEFIHHSIRIQSFKLAVCVNIASGIEYGVRTCLQV